jgi:hypothetical protein
MDKLISQDPFRKTYHTIHTLAGLDLATQKLRYPLSWLRKKMSEISGVPEVIFIVKLLTQIWRKSYAILTQFWRNSDAILTQFWRNSDAILMQFLHNSYAILTQFLRNSYAILTQFWHNSDEILTKFWRNSDAILVLSSRNYFHCKSCEIWNRLPQFCEINF